VTRPGVADSSAVRAGGERQTLTAQSELTLFVVCRISASNGRLRPDLRPSRSTNVANFGAFVDIGVHQDGLVHVSQLAERFVVEMPAGIVLAASGEHNDALLRRGPLDRL
jgi:S1 RNA binding domain